jgi:hypothetical protein
MHDARCTMHDARCKGNMHTQVAIPCLSREIISQKSKEKRATGKAHTELASCRLPIDIYLYKNLIHHVLQGCDRSARC